MLYSRGIPWRFTSAERQSSSFPAFHFPDPAELCWPAESPSHGPQPLPPEVGASGSSRARLASPVRRLARNGGAGTVGAMPMTVDQIVEQTRSMPQDVVAELVDRILLTMHGGQESAASSAWSDTVQRRTAEIRSGQVQGVPGAVTAEKIRQIVGR